MRHTLSSLLIVACLANIPSAHAQIVNLGDDVSRPIPGAGHDYIHVLAETVNPANGSLSIKIDLPTPKGRGLSLPFAITYNSGEVFHFGSGMNGCGTLDPAKCNSNPTYVTDRSQAGHGWTDSLPYATFSASTATFYNPLYSNANGPFCPITSSYIFYDPEGGSHLLDLAALGTMTGHWGAPPPSQQCSNVKYGSGSGYTYGYSRIGGDSQVVGQMDSNCTGYQNTGDCQFAAPAFTVTDANGTVYSFPANTVEGSGSPSTSVVSFIFPSQIEDRNGNILSFNTSESVAPGLPVIDTMGRSLISNEFPSSSGATYIDPTSYTVGGLTYTLTYTTTSANYSVGSTQVYNGGIKISGVNCTFWNSVSEASIPVLSKITLPDGQYYQFKYDSTYGLVNEIDYPGGGWVKYTWGLSTNPSTLGTFAGDQGSNNPPFVGYCNYEYQTPVIKERQVGYSTGSAAALTQVYSYTTAWNGLTWTSKATTLATTDNVTNLTSQTNFTYGYVNQQGQINTGGQSPAQIPVENTITYYDWGNTTTPIKTVTKTWATQFEMTSQTTVLNQSYQTVTNYSYTGAYFEVLGEKDESDYGQTTLERTTKYQYYYFSPPPQMKSCPKQPCGYWSPILVSKPSQIVTYNASGTRIAETDAYYDGQTPSSSTTVSWPAANVIASTHDATNFGPTATIARGDVTMLVKWASTGTSPTTTYTYDDTGQTLSKTDPCGNTSCPDITGSNQTTTYSYTDNFASGTGTPPGPTNAYVTLITHPNTGTPHSESYTWGYNNGSVYSHTDVQNSLTTTYAYADPLFRLTQVTNPDGGTTTYSYNDAPPNPTVTVSKQINSTQSVTNLTKMDGIGHTIQTQLTSDPQGTVYSDTAYTGLGPVYTQSNPYRSGSDITSSPGTTTYAYDALGRKTSETYPDTSVLTTAYCGPSTLVTDPTKRWRRSRTDGLGFLVEVDEPNSTSASVASNGCPSGSDPIWVTSYGNDVLGNLTSVLQNGSHARSFSFDSLSRMLSSNNPEVSTITYTYDANGNVYTKTDARTITTTYGYDDLNRELTRTYSNLDPTVTTTYDQSACLGLSTCQNVGQRTSVTDAAGSEAWSYHIDATNPDTTKRTIHLNQRTTISSPSNVTKTTTYYLDLAGNVNHVIYPTGRSITYHYDNADRASNAQDDSSGMTYATGWQTGFPTGCVATAACYTPQGSVYAVSIGQTSTFTGLNITDSYNSRLQPNEFKASSTGGNAMDITYSFLDPSNNNKNSGHVFSIANNLNSGRNQYFTYDQVNRLTSAGTGTNTTGPYCWGYLYTYDPWGNLLSQSGWTPNYNGCTESVLAPITADGNNHISAFAYDLSGNTSNDGTYGYAWDGESRLKSSTYNSATTNYVYDGDGRRVAKVGSKLYWYGAGGEILAETDSSGNVINEFVFFSGRRVARIAW